MGEATPTRRVRLAIYCATGLSALLFFSPISVLFLRTRGVALQDIFLMETVLLLTLLASDLPTGILADRVGRREVTVLGYALAAIAQVIFAIGHGLAPYLTESAVAGVGIACVSGAEPAYLQDAMQLDRRGLEKLFGRLDVIRTIAGIVAAASASRLVVVSIGFPAALSAVAVVMALVAALALPRAPARRPPARESGRVLRATVVAAISRPTLLAFGAISSLGFVVFNDVVYFNQLAFRHSGISPESFGWIVAAGMGFGALGAMCAPRLARRFGGDRVVPVMLCVGAAGILALSSHIVMVTVAAYWTTTLSGVTALPLVKAALTDLAPSDTRAAVLSAVSTVGTAIAAGLNPLVGALFASNFVSGAGACAAVLLALAGWCAVRTTDRGTTPGPPS